MAANPNTLNYWRREGSFLPPYMLGTVSETGDLDYWRRGGTIEFPAAIQSQGSQVTVPVLRPLIVSQAIKASVSP